LHSNARFEEVKVEAWQLATPRQSGSFWRRWIEAHGRRTDRLLLLHNLQLCYSTPMLCSLAGVLQARTVALFDPMVQTLRLLRGLLNLVTTVEHFSPEVAPGRVSLEPLAGLPVLELDHVQLKHAVAISTSLAALSNLAALTSLSIYNNGVPQLDVLSSVIRQLRGLELNVFAVTGAAPLSCLTYLMRISLKQGACMY
jgi:hypothetical protein